MKTVSTTYTSGEGRSDAPAGQRRELVPNAVLGMWLFLFVEIMMFIGLISAYLVLRSQAGIWPPPGQPRLPVEVTAFNTILLLASGWTMWQVLPALRRDGPARAARWIWFTFGLGTAFLVLQGVEWLRLVHFGLTTSSSIYGGLFYTLIGMHGLHVCAALAALGLAVNGLQRNRYTAARPDGLLAIRLFWFFVTGIWPVLYALVYLL